MPHGRELGLNTRDIVLDGDPALFPQKGAEPPIFGPCLLWPNGWMNQDALGREVGRGPGHIVLDGDPAPPLRARGHRPPIFGPCLLWPNGWMNQDATWYEGRPRPGNIVLDADPCPPQGSQPSHNFSAHICCCQTAGLKMMPLGTKIGLRPGHIVLHGDPAP